VSAALRVTEEGTEEREAVRARTLAAADARRTPGARGSGSRWQSRPADGNKRASGSGVSDGTGQRGAQPAFRALIEAAPARVAAAERRHRAQRAPPAARRAREQRACTRVGKDVGPLRGAGGGGGERPVRGAGVPAASAAGRPLAPKPPPNWK
jgi:hypothetical protein